MKSESCILIFLLTKFIKKKQNETNKAKRFSLSHKFALSGSPPKKMDMHVVPQPHNNPTKQQRKQEYGRG